MAKQIGTFLLVLLLGCASSNLSERPLWAKRSKLTKELLKKYPPHRFLAQVVMGVGKDLQEAEKKAEEEAYRVFSSMIVSKVSQTYEKRSHVFADAYRKNIQSQVKQYLQVMAKDILLAGLKKVESWDGYDREKIYYFAIYVLDKRIAKRVLEERTRKTYQAIRTAWQNLQGTTFSRDRELAALETLKHLLSFEVLKDQALFFGIQWKQAENLEKWKQQCLQVLSQSIEQRMAKGDQKSLEEALELAEKFLKYYPLPDVQGKIREIKRRLPCVECGFSGKCIHCKGQRGFFYICPTCRGNKYVSVRCPVCRGDGKRACHRCNGTGKVTVLCQYCNGKGRVICPTCRGKGFVLDICRLCKGAGKVLCSRCRGRGKVLTFQNKRVTCFTCKGKGNLGYQICHRCRGRGVVISPFTKKSVLCPVCRGKKRILQTCTRCQGKGWLMTKRQIWVRCSQCQGQGQILCPECRGARKRKYKCTPPLRNPFFWGRNEDRFKYCNGLGTVPCPQCRGALRVPVTCPECQGTGRTGICPRCQGTGRVTVPCPTCPIEHKGRIFKGCSHCKGTGVCPVCKGVGHRV